MNRELKLSLIMGFALVLAVGVLISDHFSTARGPGSASPDVMADSALQGSFGSGPESIASRPLGTWNDDIPKQEPDLASDIAAIADRSGDAIAKSFIDWQEDAKDQPLALQTDPVDPQVQPDPQAQAGDEPQAGVQPEKPRFPEVFVNDGKRKLDGSDTPWGSPPTPGSSAEPRTYVVDADDTLWGIAQEFYGDGALYKQLARHNEGRLGPDFSVRKGSRLILPDPAALGAAPRSTPADKPVNVAGGSDKPEAKPESKPQNKPEAKPETKTGPSRTYIVQKNDTLSQIAQRELGTIKRMNEIIALNSDKIDSADDIWVGLKLKLPKT